NPGAMNTVFTEQTRFGLAQWQAQHHYPGAVPASAQTVTVSLGQGTGYQLGAQTSAGLVIGPGGARTTAATPAATHPGGVTAVRADVSPLAVPALRIQSVNANVAEGTPATFVITASSASASDITVNLARGGTATSNDIVIPPSTVTLAANTTSVQVSVPTRV